MEVFKINKKNRDSIIERAVQILNEGEIIIIPTDTVYGLACKWDVTDALKRMFILKGRSKDKPIPLLLSNISMLNLFEIEMSNELEDFLRSVWPGAVTVVLEVNRNYPMISKDEKVGFRIPNDRFCIDLINKTGYPLAATSANLTEEEPVMKKETFINLFENHIKYLVLGGNLSAKPSSVLCYEKGTITKIR